jgi:hypothetical protein
VGVSGTFFKRNARPFHLEVTFQSSMINADDRLSLDPTGPIEGGNGIVERSHFAYVCSQTTIAEPLNKITQLRAIGYDDEIDRHAVSGSRFGRARDGNQSSCVANHVS